MAWYLDSSALVKLIAEERGSVELADAIRDGGWILTTSALSLVEIVRAASRKGPREVAEARSLLRRTTMLELSIEVLELAGQLQPPSLRSLDAVHVASALVLKESCEGIVTYDQRMAEAARANGLTVLAPGAVDEV